jgi:hypothetical protein
MAGLFAAFLPAYLALRALRRRAVHVAIVALLSNRTMSELPVEPWTSRGRLVYTKDLMAAA